MTGTVKTARRGSWLELRVEAPEEGLIEVHIESDRNRPVSKFTDPSPYAPPGAGSAMKPVAGAEMWFPVVDVALEPGMEAQAVFSPESKGVWSINGMFYREEHALEREITILGDRLEHWENSLLVRGEPVALEQFRLVQRFCVRGDVEFTHVFRLLSTDWSGTLSVFSVKLEGRVELGTVRVEPDAAVASIAARASASATAVSAGNSHREATPGSSGLEPERLQRALAGILGYLQRSRNTNPHSPTCGGPYQFYDLDARTYRMPHWMWGWGPVVKLLLDASESPALLPAIDRNALREYARSIGDTALSFQIRDPRHPAYGGVTNRWDPALRQPFGYQQCACTADALFFAGWAWVPLFEATQDVKYLEASTLLARHTKELLGRFELIPQQFHPDSGIWSDHTIDEVGFGTEGLAELYRATQDPFYRDLTGEYMQQCLAKFQREDGLWERGWKRSTREVTPTGYMTRGLGWAMEGLLAAHRAQPDGGYLALAERMAERILEYQREDGSWAFQFNRDSHEVGISEKGTALWSLLLYRLYAETKKPHHLAAARKALAWCLDNQYAGPDPEAHGSLVGCSPHSAVVYRRWFRVSCAYAAAFFGLAVLAEMELART